MTSKSVNSHSPGREFNSGFWWRASVSVTSCRDARDNYRFDYSSFREFTAVSLTPSLDDMTPGRRRKVKKYARGRRVVRRGSWVDISEKSF